MADNNNVLWGAVGGAVGFILGKKMHAACPVCPAPKTIYPFDGMVITQVGEGFSVEPPFFLVKGNNKILLTPIQFEDVMTARGKTSITLVDKATLDKIPTI